MTIDGVIDVADWFVAQGDHDGASRAVFESEEAAMLVGRKSFERFASFVAHSVRTAGRNPQLAAEVRRLAQHLPGSTVEVGGFDPWILPCEGIQVLLPYEGQCPKLQQLQAF